MAPASSTHPSSRPLAAVTGASSGIGLELAVQLAERGYDLVVSAEDGGLHHAADRIRQCGAEVRTVQCDLREARGVAEVYGAIAADRRPLDVLALNAGIGRGGAFVDNELADELAIIDLNIVSTVRLAKLVLRDMTAQGTGRVLVTSSIVSAMPGPYHAVYNASKSFLQSFTEALQEELRDSGVTVTSLMPGPTDTAFFARAGMLDTAIGQGPKDDPADVARQGIEALLAGDNRATGGGLKTRVQDIAAKVTPDKVKAVLHRGLAQPGSGD